LEKFHKTQQELKKNMKSIVGTMANIPFQAWALSALFFGMAIKRVFEGIAKTAVSTFNEVIHSGDKMATSFDILGGVFKFLAFTVGDALNSVFEPLVPIIIDIVMAVSQWIADNQKLVGWIIILGIALGTLLLVTGTLFLGIIGLVQAFGKLLALVASAGLGAAFWAFIGIVAAVAALFLALWVTNLGNFRDFFKETLGIIWMTVVAVFGHLGGIISNLWKAILALLSGDTDAFIKHLGKAVGHLMALLSKVIAAGVAVILNIIVLSINLLNDMVQGLVGIVQVLANIIVDIAAKTITKVVDMFGWGFELLISFINKLVDAWNAISSKLGGPTIDFDISWSSSKAKRGIEEMASSFKSFLGDRFDASRGVLEAIKQGYVDRAQLAEGFGNIDSAFGVGRSEPSTETITPDKKGDTFNIANLNIENPQDMESLLEEFKRLTPSG
jgi:phage-related protein